MKLADLNSTMVFVNDVTLLMVCVVCGKEHNAIRRQDGTIINGAFYCRYGCTKTNHLKP